MAMGVVQVAEAVHEVVRRFSPSGQAEKTSYDDFYIDVTAECSAQSPGGAVQQTPPEGLKIVGEGLWETVDPELQRGALVKNWSTVFGCCGDMIGSFAGLAVMIMSSILVS